MTHVAPSPRRAPRLGLSASATLVLLGIAFAVSDQQELGGWLTVAALLVLIGNLHRLGRTGPDDPARLG